MDKIRELIKSKLKEISATSQGGASFSPGEGAQYATPFAFRKNKKSKSPANIYYYKLGFKPVPKIKPKSYDIKKLFETEKLNELNDVQKRRLNSLDEIERMLKEINPLISNMKNDTIELYSGNAGSYDINEPIEIVLSYLKDIKKLLTDK